MKKRPTLNVRTRSEGVRNAVALAVVVCGLGGVALALWPRSADAQTGRPPAAANVWRVRNGFVGTDAGPSRTLMPNNIFVLNQFLPGRLEIAVGDTVAFELGGRHTVALGRGRIPLADPITGVPNPEPALPKGGNTFDGRSVVQSGLIEGPDTFEVTFSAPGEFDVFCDIHGGQAMKVVVKPAGSSLPRTPQELTATVEAQLVDIYTKVIPSMLAQHARVDLVANADGTWAHGVAAGFGDRVVSGHRFLPASLVVRAGEWVRWTNPDPATPHTVTLLPGGGLPGDGSSPFPEGFLNFTSYGGAVYTGQELIHAPVLPDAFANPARGPNEHASRAIRFDTPGTYFWYCILHLPEMQGAITVLPRD